MNPVLRAILCGLSALTMAGVPALGAPANVVPASTERATVLRDATLIDGSGDPPREHVNIVLRAGLVERIVASGSVPVEGGTTVDCRGKTVIPGLVSAHSHLGVLENNAAYSPTAYNEPNVLAALRQFERYGVTTILSLGMNRDLVYRLREQQRLALLPGASILTAGRGIGVPNGVPPLALPDDQVDRPATPDEARRDVDAFAAQRADIVKIWVDPQHGKMPEMDTVVYTAVIDEAHKLGLQVAAHEYALDDARQLVDDGVDVLAHSVRDRPVDEAFTRSMLQHHTWYIPTLALDEAFYLYASDPELLRSRFFREAAGPQLLAKFTAADYAAQILADPATAEHRADADTARRNLKTLYDAKVRIAFGTDSGAAPGRIPGFSEHRELEDLVAAGLTPLQALNVATGRTGELLHGLDPHVTVGLVAPGYAADLIVLAASPLVDIRNTRTIVAVYHRGRGVPDPAPRD